MDFLGGYGSGDEAPAPEYSTLSVNTAPAVAIVSKAHPLVLRHDQKELTHNVTADVLMAPVQGPTNPFKFNHTGPGKAAGMGSIEDTVVENYAFDEQYQTYQRSGFAVDISTNQILGSVDEFNAANGETAQTARGAGLFFPRRPEFQCMTFVLVLGDRKQEGSRKAKAIRTASRPRR